MPLTKLLKSLQLKGLTLTVSEDELKSINESILRPDSTRLGDPFSKLTIDTVLGLDITSELPLSVPYKVEITAKDWVYALIDGHRYCDAEGVINNSIDVLLETFVQKVSDPGRGSALSNAYSNMGNVGRFGEAIKEGCLAYVEMYKRKGRKSYLTKGLRLFDRLDELGDFKGTLVMDMNPGHFLDKEIWWSALEKGDYPAVLKLAIDFYLENDKHNLAERLVETSLRFGCKPLGKYLERQLKHYED